MVNLSDIRTSMSREVGLIIGSGVVTLLLFPVDFVRLVGGLSNSTSSAVWPADLISNSIRVQNIDWLDSSLIGASAPYSYLIPVICVFVLGFAYWCLYELLGSVDHSFALALGFARKTPEREVNPSLAREFRFWKWLKKQELGSFGYYMRSYEFATFVLLGICWGCEVAVVLWWLLLPIGSALGMRIPSMTWILVASVGVVALLVYRSQKPRIEQYYIDVGKMFDATHDEEGYELEKGKLPLTPATKAVEEKSSGAGRMEKNSVNRGLVWVARLGIVAFLLLELVLSSGVLQLPIWMEFVVPWGFAAVVIAGLAYHKHRSGRKDLPTASGAQPPIPPA